MTRRRPRRDSTVTSAPTTERTVRRLWALVENVAVEGHPDRVVLLTPWGEEDLGRRGLSVEYLLRRMAMGPVSLANAHSTDDRERLEVLLGELSGAVVHCLAMGKRARPMVTVLPVSHPAPFTPSPLDPRDVVRLSRWASIRPVAGALSVSAPTARHEVLCERSELGALLSRLATARQVSDLIGTDPRVFADDASWLSADDTPPSADLLEVLSFLVAAGVVVRRSAVGAFAEDRDPDLRRWTPFELEFDVRSRREEVNPPDPALGPEPDGAPTRAPVLEVDATVALPARFPTPGPHASDTVGALDPRTLSELLDRGMGAETVGSMPPPPWPGLELYLAVARGGALAHGIHHIDAAGRALRHLAGQDATADEVVEARPRGDGDRAAVPPALLLITAARREWPAAVGGYAASLVRAGAVTHALLLAGRTLGLEVDAVPQVAATAGWDRLVSVLWPAQTPVGACRIEVARSTSPR